MKLLRCLRRLASKPILQERSLHLSPCSYSKLKRKLKDWEGVVGLEVHVQIASESKLFSASPYNFGAPPNSQVSPFDASVPGTLPVLNRRCVEAAVLTALALNCKVNAVSHFDRKHYFYADMPAGYQITQQRSPLATGGHLDFVVFAPGSQETYFKRATLQQLQLEQDSGKSLHDAERNRSLIDLNRAGVGLMELVFDACLQDGEEAASLVKELQLVLRSLGVCSCKMEEGALRVDANVSVNRPGDPRGTRTEVKNLNSLRSVAYAVDFEIGRQIAELTSGQTIVNMTMGFDAIKRRTVPMRDKEVVQDYRFMPEPNLPPLVLAEGSDREGARGMPSVEELRRSMPVLPRQERDRLVRDHSLTLHQAQTIVGEEGFLKLFDEVTNSGVCSSKKVASWLLIELLGQLNAAQLTLQDCGLDAARFVELLALMEGRRISRLTGEDVLKVLVSGDSRRPEEIVEEAAAWQMQDDELLQLCKKVIEENPDAVKAFKRGKDRAFNALMGSAKQLSNRRADMKTAKAILLKLVAEWEGPK